MILAILAIICVWTNPVPRAWQIVITIFAVIRLIADLIPTHEDW